MVILTGMTKRPPSPATTSAQEVATCTEELRPLALAVEWLPTRRRGKPAHAATLFRWAAKGLNGIKLEVVQVGGTKCTSKEALQRFFRRLTERYQDNRGEDAGV
ncbi:MAG: hypothetical protein AMXMBFR58_11480 [Phycisphaerae bacterium]